MHFFVFDTDELKMARKRYEQISDPIYVAWISFILLNLIYSILEEILFLFLFKFMVIVTGPSKVQFRE